MPFISYVHDTRTATIDGASAQHLATTFDDGNAVQLSKAEQSESDFNWEALRETIKVVKGDNLLIFDKKDMNCLAWFINQNIKIEFAGVFISPDAIDIACERIEILKKLGQRAVEGSEIKLPSLGGYNGLGRMDKIKTAFESIGFKHNLNHV